MKNNLLIRKVCLVTLMSRGRLLFMKSSYFNLQVGVLEFKLIVEEMTRCF